MAIIRISVLSALCLAIAVLSGCRSTPEDRMERGRKRLAAGQHGHAAIEFANVVREQPRNSEAWILLAEAHLGNEAPQKAYDALTKAVDADPRNTKALHRLAGLAVVAATADLLPPLRERLINAYGNAPADAEACYLLAVIEFRLGNVEEAAARLEEALERKPGYVEAAVSLGQIKLGQKDAARAEKILRSVVNAAPDNPEAHVELALFLGETRRAEEAEAEFRRALQIDAKHPRALAGLGALFGRTGRPELAAAQFRTLTESGKPEYRHAYAGFLLESGKSEEALRELERLSSAWPDDRQIRTRLVDLYQATGDSVRARQVLQAALAKTPTDSDALRQMALMLIRAGKYSEAEKPAAEFLELRPEDGSGHHMMAQIHAARGEAEQQRQRLGRAIQLDPALLPARLQLARLQLAAGSPQTALGTLEGAPAQQKSEFTWLVTRNDIFVALHDERRLRDGIQETLRFGRTPHVALHSAVLNLWTRDYAAARADVETVLSADKVNAEAWRVLREISAAQRQMPAYIERLRRTLSDPDAGPPLRLAGARLLAQSGQLEEARRILATVPDEVRGQKDAAMLAADLDVREGRFDTARKALEPLVAADPTNSDARLLLAEADRRAGDASAAIRQYEAVLQTDGKNIYALNNLAWLLASNDPDRALQYAQRAVEAAPESAAVHHTLGTVYFRKGLYPAAIRHFQTAVERERTSRREYDLGLARTKAGDESGRQLIRKALAEDPKLDASGAMVP